MSEMSEKAAKAWGVDPDELAKEMGSSGPIDDMPDNTRILATVTETNVFTSKAGNVCVGSQYTAISVQGDGNYGTPKLFNNGGLLVLPGDEPSGKRVAIFSRRMGAHGVEEFTPWAEADESGAADLAGALEGRKVILRIKQDPERAAGSEYTTKSGETKTRKYPTYEIADVEAVTPAALEKYGLIDNGPGF